MDLVSHCKPSSGSTICAILCILSLFLYGSEIRCLTSTLEQKINALDNKSQTHLSPYNILDEFCLQQ